MYTLYYHYLCIYVIYTCFPIKMWKILQEKSVFLLKILQEKMISNLRLSLQSTIHVVQTTIYEGKKTFPYYYRNDL